MTHSQEQNSGWIEYDGNGIPVGREENVVIRLRDGTEGPEGGFPAGYFWWGRGVHANGEGGIVSYRVHQPSPSSQGDEQ